MTGAIPGADSDDPRVGAVPVVTGPNLVRSTAIMSVGTILSRVTGVARLAAITAAIGVAEGKLADTYNLANTAPNIIYDLFLGGILTSLFVPVFVELLEKEGRAKAWEVASALMNLAVVLLAAIAVLGILAAPWIAEFYAVRLEGAQAEAQRGVLTFLLRLLLPQIVFYGIAATVTGMLNAHKRFGPAAYAPILNNLLVIGVFLWVHRTYSNVDLDADPEQLWVIGLGTTAGIALMALVQLPFLRGLGRYRLTLSMRHPAVRKLFRLSVYVAGFVATNQIGYLIIQWLANAQRGGYTAYLAAFTFFIFPNSLFVLSVTTALIPGMSEHAVHERWDAFRERVSVGVRATLFLILPASFGYLVLARPIVELLLENGVMTDASTDLVTGVLMLMVLGLPQFALFQLFVRSFYAMQNTKTPFLVNLVVIALNSAINVPMFVWFGVEGLAAGQAIVYTGGSAIVARLLSRRLAGIEGRRIAASAVRIAAASLAMAAVVWAARDLAAPSSEAFFGQALALTLPLVAGAAAYLLFAHLLRVEELGYVRALLRRRA